MKSHFLFKILSKYTPKRNTIVKCFQKFLHENYPIASMYLKYLFLIYKWYFFKFLHKNDNFCIFEIFSQTPLAKRMASEMQISESENNNYCPAPPAKSWLRP